MLRLIAPESTFNRQLYTGQWHHGEVIVRVGDRVRTPDGYTGIVQDEARRVYGRMIPEYVHVTYDPDPVELARFRLGMLYRPDRLQPLES